MVGREVPLGYIALGYFLFLQEPIKHIIIIIKATRLDVSCSKEVQRAEACVD
jgi:hypothetical protein